MPRTTKSKTTGETPLTEGRSVPLSPFDAAESFADSVPPEIPATASAPEPLAPPLLAPAPSKPATEAIASPWVRGWAASAEVPAAPPPNPWAGSPAQAAEKPAAEKPAAEKPAAEKPAAEAIDSPWVRGWTASAEPSAAAAPPPNPWAATPAAPPAVEAQPIATAPAAVSPPATPTGLARVPVSTAVDPQLLTSLTQSGAIVPAEKCQAFTRQVVGAVENLNHGIVELSERMSAHYALLCEAATKRVSLKELLSMTQELSALSAAAGKDSALREQALFLRQAADVYLQVLDSMTATER